MGGHRDNPFHSSEVAVDLASRKDLVTDSSVRPVLTGAVAGLRRLGHDGGSGVAVAPAVQRERSQELKGLRGPDRYVAMTKHLAKDLSLRQSAVEVALCAYDNYMRVMEFGVTVPY